MTAGLVPAPVRIVGTGLIGGSLGLCLSGQGVAVQVQDVSPGTVALAVELGVGEPVTAGSDAPGLVIVAAPPDVAAQLVVTALQESPEAVVADVASVKRTVLDGVRAAVGRGEIPAADLARYVGAHPMAGREVAGVIAARGDLFQGRPFVVAPHEGTSDSATSALRALAVDVGSVPFVLDADAHDDAVARVSHVPQITASLLAATLIETSESALSLAGGGLRDTTRIAASDPRLWVEILGANARAIRPVLAEMQARLGDVDAALASLTGSPDPAIGSRRAIAELIAAGNRGVGRIPGKHGGASEAFATVTVLVPDRPGELARLLGEIGDIGVNLEDLRLEHTLGRRVGLAHVSVARGREARLTQDLSERGWTVVED